MKNKLIKQIKFLTIDHIYRALGKCRLYRIHSNELMKAVSENCCWIALPFRVGRVRAQLFLINVASLMNIHGSKSPAVVIQPN